MTDQLTKRSRNSVCLLSFLCGLLLAGRLFAGQAVLTKDLTPEAIEVLKRAVQLELDERVSAGAGTPVYLPGVTAAFGLPGEQTAAFAAGFSDLESGVAMRVDTRMPAGSVGKMLVAAVTLSLVADKVLKLDEPVSRWLGDEGWFSRLPNNQTLSLRHLLNHSGGIIDHVFDEGSGFADWFSKDIRANTNELPVSRSIQDAIDQAFCHSTLVQFVLDREPLFAVGKGFHYTDTGYILIGLIIEKATGIPYYELLESRFLKPLALTLTAPLDQREFSNLAQGYAVETPPALGLPNRVLKNGRLVFNPLVEWTGGGVVSNPQDLVRWSTAMFDEKILGAKSLTEILTSMADQGMDHDSAGRPLGYGLGISIVKTDVGTVYRHGGFFPGYQSMVAYFPDHRISLAMQINSDGADLEAHFNAVRDVIFQTLKITN